MYIIIQININCVNCKQNEGESLSCTERTEYSFTNMGQFNIID